MGFTRPSDYPEAGELLPHHFALTLRQKNSAYGRYVSVALSLKLPSPGVTRHPLPRSPDFPHYRISPVPRLSVLHLFYYSIIELALQEFYTIASLSSAIPIVQLSPALRYPLIIASATISSISFDISRLIGLAPFLSS